MVINRRQIMFGLASVCCSCPAVQPRTLKVSQGCVYSQAYDGSSSGDHIGIEDFPGLRFIGQSNEELALAPIAIELSEIFDVKATLAMYDDSPTCGNAKSINKAFLSVPGLPYETEGTIAIGTKLFKKLLTFDHATASIAAVCAHEYGHLLQLKHIEHTELTKIKDEDGGSVVRHELLADFICGYHAGVRKVRQEDYAAVIQPLNQFRAGDRMFGRNHHGTPAERGRAVVEGIRLAIDGRRRSISPKAIAETGLAYVKTLKPEIGSSEPGCV